MNKTLETLYERATRRGVANLNARQFVSYYGPSDDLESKYRVTIENGVTTLEHWGTVIYELNPKASHLGLYIQSKSDSDAINTTGELTGINIRTGFKPVNGGGYVYQAPENLALDFVNNF